MCAFLCVSVFVCVLVHVLFFSTDVHGLCESDGVSGLKAGAKQTNLCVLVGEDLPNALVILFPSRQGKKKNREEEEEEEGKKGGGERRGRGV